VWTNITNERVGRVAESLDDFRARFAYNLEDDHVRALAAEVPVIAQWDDHETHNNWFPGQQLDDARYHHERDCSRLSAMALRATFDWMPMVRGKVHRVIRYGPLLDVFVLDCRSFRSANGTNLGDAAMLGSAQLEWLAGGLAASRARWKLVACDQPIALVIPDGANHQEGWANADPGAPRGRERELAALLERMKRDNVANVAWVTADVHYAAAHHFDPARSTVAFDPFWEFVAGPIHAGNFGPSDLDPTLGGEVRFQWGMPPAGVDDVGPWDGLQSFGTLDVTREALTVILWGIDGASGHAPSAIERYRTEIPYRG
jgi:alkaline phosphatase D